ncbi:MAG TPA: response regulator, partial [Acetobacteraceae bacterium]|nr:response regulator [Acetobacteraceae bacterium]
MVRAGVRDDERLIAIVDDDASMLEAIKALIRSLGFAAEAFSGGSAFLSSPYLSQTCCLIADVNMPGMSGLELHRNLVTSGRPIPTVLITAYPNDQVRARALSAGVIGYLSKPFGEDELLSCIR